jgi:hypothetical protein
MVFQVLITQHSGALLRSSSITVLYGIDAGICNWLTLSQPVPLAQFSDVAPFLSDQLKQPPGLDVGASLCGLFRFLRPLATFFCSGSYL